MDCSISPDGELFTVINVNECAKNNTNDENVVYPDNEIDRADVEGLEGMEIGDIMLQFNCFVLLERPDAIVLNSELFLTDIFSFENLKLRFSSFSSFPMVDWKRQWQAQSKPKHRKTRTQTQTHQPKTFEFAGLPLQAHC